MDDPARRCLTMLSNMAALSAAAGKTKESPTTIATSEGTLQRRHGRGLWSGRLLQGGALCTRPDSNAS